MIGMGKLGIVSLVLAVAMCSCASKSDPEYAKRVAEYGKPDLISEQAAMTPRYYSADLASHRPPRPSEVYYYLQKDRQISFRRGMEPSVNPIPPTMKDFVASMARQTQ
jgi:hypothetical protein